MKSLYLLLVLPRFFLFSTQTIIGQQNTKIDSLLKVFKTQPNDTNKVNTLQNLFQSYLYNEPELALDYAQKALELSQSLDYKKGAARSYYDIGVYYSNASQEDSTLTNYRKAAKLFNEISSLKGHVLVKSGMAIFEFDRGNFDKALKINDSVITLLNTRLNDSVALARAYGIQGSLHVQKGNYQIALKQILKQVSLLENLDEKVMLADSYNNLAAIELTNENYEESIAYNEKALGIYKEFNDVFYQAVANNDIGMAHYNLQDRKSVV